MLNFQNPLSFKFLLLLESTKLHTSYNFKFFHLQGEHASCMHWHNLWGKLTTFKLFCSTLLSHHFDILGVCQMNLRMASVFWCAWNQNFLLKMWLPAFGFLNPGQEGWMGWVWPAKLAWLIRLRGCQNTVCPLLREWRLTNWSWWPT